MIDTDIKQVCPEKNMCELCIKRLRAVIAHVFKADGGGMCSQLNADRQHDVSISGSHTGSPDPLESASHSLGVRDIICNKLQSDAVSLKTV